MADNTRAMTTRNVVFMLSVLALSIAAWPCLAAQLPLSKGFGETAWGSDVSARPGFLKLRTARGIDYFVNLRERYTMAGFGRVTAYYGQVDGRLYAVHLLLSDHSAAGGLSKELARLYGKGKKNSRGEERWKTGPVRVKLSEGRDGSAKLSFYYQPVAATIPLAVREAEPDPAELMGLLPPGKTPAAVPAGAVPPKPEDYVGIDVLKMLRQGASFLKR